PAAVGLILIGRPLISLLERGAFDADDSALVYGALQFFAFGLIFQSLHEVIARSFYADRDTLTPLWAALIAAVANVIIVGGLYLAYTYRFEDTVRTSFNTWGEQYAAGSYEAGLTTLNGASDSHRDLASSLTGVGGLALGYSTVFLIELGLLLVLLRRRWHDIDARQLGQTTLRTVAASITMGAAVLLFDAVLGVMGWHEAGFILTALRVMGLAGVGAVSFVAAGLLFRLNELTTLWRLVVRRKARPAV
ncbi:MAG: hypothetical protein HY866_08195, partial [Chloroflexi bacterium]|nr:hypothetical protein [Chloroflexota bacterium]